MNIQICCALDKIFHRFSWEDTFTLSEWHGLTLNGTWARVLISCYVTIRNPYLWQIRELKIKVSGKCVLCPKTTYHGRSRVERKIRVQLDTYPWDYLRAARTWWWECFCWGCLHESKMADIQIFVLIHRVEWKESHYALNWPLIALLVSITATFSIKYAFIPFTALQVTI